MIIDNVHSHLVNWYTLFLRCNAAPTYMSNIHVYVTAPVAVSSSSSSNSSVCVCIYYIYIIYLNIPATHCAVLYDYNTQLEIETPQVFSSV